MRNSYLINLFLVFIVVGLFWFSSHTSTTSDTDITKLSDIETNVINSILITRLDKPEIKLTKQSSTWKIIQPIEAAGNKTRIKLILSLLSSPIHNQLSHPSDDVLKNLGLKPIKLSLQLNNDVFVFGDIEPIGKRRYVLYENTVYLIDDKVSPMLIANVASFIDNQLLPVNTQITKIQLPQLNNDNFDASSSVTFIPEGNIWTSTPQVYPTEKLAATISNWQQASAMQVRPANKLDKDNKSATPVLLWLNNQAEPIKFDVQMDERNLYLLNSDKQLRYQFPASLVHQLFLSTITTD